MPNKNDNTLKPSNSLKRRWANKSIDRAEIKFQLIYLEKRFPPTSNVSKLSIRRKRVIYLSMTFAEVSR